MENLILKTDSYKASHWLQYPENTQYVYSYIESRGGEFENTVFFGLQMFIKKYLTKPITQEMIDEADEFFKLHGEPFNREGWEYILNKHKGYMPVLIRAVPEGMIVPTHNVLVTIENTDHKCFWLTSYLETMIMRAVWYPTTVATVSRYAKKIILSFLNETCDNPEAEIPFKLHDFGGRGVSSGESAEIGGAAHLVNFLGSDTVEGIWAANKYYNEPMAGFSIPAAEHSTMTLYGKDHEADAFRSMLRNFAGPGKLVAVVSDSYDIYNAVENIWGKELREEVLATGGTVVIRPDSGHPPTVVLKVVSLLDKAFGSTVNKKGYRVLNPAVRVIQGDGINLKSIREILEKLTDAGYSAENVAFGMGGGLLQHPNRDTLNFAMKASWALVDGKPRNVFKQPVDMGMKASKPGRLVLIRDNGRLITVPADDPRFINVNTSILRAVFMNGNLGVTYTLQEVRDNANANLL